MKQLHDLFRAVLTDGKRQPNNRTGIDTIRLPYASMMNFDLSLGFPLLTTKAMAWKSLVGELFGFLRAAESAEDFRELGCNWWDQNANGNSQWLASPFRKGEDDLGRIYGAQWRRWLGPLDYRNDELVPPQDQSPFRIRMNGGIEWGVYAEPFDQVITALELIKKDPSDRGIIINGWRPDEFKQMALRPCHVLYQFTVDQTSNEISLTMYQRSGDMFLGVPVNVASSALLLHIFGHVTGLTPRYLSHVVADAHIYVNHLEQVEELLSRQAFKLPSLQISDRIPRGEIGNFNPHVIDQLQPRDIELVGYQAHPSIKAPMAV